jgi:hypothetical protein
MNLGMTARFAGVRGSSFAAPGQKLPRSLRIVGVGPHTHIGDQRSWFINIDTNPATVVLSGRGEGWRSFQFLVRSFPQPSTTRGPSMRLLIALILPWLSFFTIGRPLAGIICLLLQITLIGWLPATIWAVFALSQYKTDKKIAAAMGR